MCLALSKVERGVCALGLGLSIWPLVVLGLGLAGCLSQLLFVALLFACAAIELVLQTKDLRARHRESNAQREQPSRRQLLLFAVAVVPFIVLAALAAMLPPFDFDVKEYHLGGPKEWFLDGRVHFLPHNVYTSFPALTEMLSLSTMVVRGDWYRGALAGQLVLWFFLPLATATVFAIGRRLFGTTAGLCGAAISRDDTLVVSHRRHCLCGGGACLLSRPIVLRCRSRLGTHACWRVAVSPCASGRSIRWQRDGLQVSRRCAGRDSDRSHAACGRDHAKASGGHQPSERMANWRTFFRWRSSHGRPLARQKRNRNRQPRLPAPLVGLRWTRLECGAQCELEGRS